ncbi:ferritin-like domain-containing protein [Reyranella sp.]|uniref:ferritin-like domain-containing protein n=1 Tax=Reyranella sp. TaxID=1929291 RepID=UPI003D0F5FAD
MYGRREYLIHLLTEAAEIEHNLLCSYLYAAFSLKRGGESSAREFRALDGWRATIMGVAIEEMGHLALVNNMLVATGGAPHFDRPNLPVAPGYHPAAFVVRLMPLTRSALDHFIYLERPLDESIADGRDFRAREPMKRTPTPGHFTPSTPDYDTIGEFYGEIRETLLALANSSGSGAILDTADRQCVVDMPGVIPIRNLSDALSALDTIVEQGEGSTSEKADCHFARFRAMREEWLALEALNPDFAPAHPAAYDPVMRRPSAEAERVWVTNPPAERLLDLGNAMYGFTLMLLEQAYAIGTPQQRRAGLAAAAMTMMRTLSDIGHALVQVPAVESGAVNAGLTFAVPRNLRSASAESAVRLSLERLEELRRGAEALGLARVRTAIDRAAAQVNS